MVQGAAVSGWSRQRIDGVYTAVALVALACIVGHVGGPTVAGGAGVHMPMAGGAGGAGVVVGIAAVACSLLLTRGARLAVAVAALGLVLLRAAAAVMPGTAAALADLVGLLVLLTAAVVMLVVEWSRR